MMASVTPPTERPPATDAPPPTTTELLDLAQLAAERAAALLLDELHHSRSLVETKTTGTDMVTEMDRAAERQIVATIRRQRPHDAIVGEEGTAEPGFTGVEWIVDPIDGTTNYLYAYPGFAVSIAAAVDGEVVAGVVVDPLHDEVFTAAKGAGAARNGEPINVSDRAELGQALVATGFSYEPERRRRQAEVLVQVLPAVRDIRRMGAAAVDLCSVGCGRVDAFYEKGLARWDYAAGALVAAEAGAVIADLAGGPPSSAFTLAAAPEVFEPLRALLIAARAGDA
jgi:myo-inositol-1(or 4)-monophosphatase